MEKLCKFFRYFLVCFSLTVISLCSANAAEDTIKVGLKYDSSALYSANLQNVTGYGYGYAIGYFDHNRDFVPLGTIDSTNKISMTGDSAIGINSDGTYYEGGSSIGAYHIELPQSYATFDEAKQAATAMPGAFPVYVNGRFAVRFGSFQTIYDAQSAAPSYGGIVVSPSRTGITCTITTTQTILFQFDGGGNVNLGIMPMGADPTVTWFKGYKYYGGFEYIRNGGNLTVVNVLPVDEYVKGVIPYEMSPSWPQEALAAQAVCARTYALRIQSHNSDPFDVCNTIHCQVYYGVGQANANTDAAVERTAGLCMTYEGELIEAVYAASNGGASEDAEHVWGNEIGYLKGKLDPYEAMTDIPDYDYTVTFTAGELTTIMNQKGYNVGTVTDLYVSEFTDVGNVKELTVVGTSGTKTITGEKCRTVFNSVISGKTVKSQRYTINGQNGGTTQETSYSIAGGGTVTDLSGLYTISGNGTVTQMPENAYVITDSGTVSASGSSRTAEQKATGGTFTISGTGNGHNVGMSQYGAKAMAENGYTYDQILHFYYTDVSIEKVGIQ